MPLQDIFKAQSIQKFRSVFSGYDLIVVDEAQKVPQIGTGLKMIVDHLPSAIIIILFLSSMQGRF